MMPHAASHYASDTIRNDSGANAYRFKKEMVDDTQRGCLSKFKSPGDNTNHSNGFVPMSSQQGKLKLIVQERYSPKEADVGSWLRDEPADTSAGGFLLSGSGSAIGRNNFSGGQGGTDTKIEVGGVHCFTDRSNGSPAHSTNGEMSSLLAQLRATKIKESILLEGIQRLGGGQKGLRRLVRTILVWVRAKSQAQSAERSTSHSELSSPSLDEFPWSNLDSGSAVDGSQGQSGQQHHQTLNHVHLTNRHSSSSPPLDLSCMMNSNSSGRDSDVNGSLCGLSCGDRGSGDLCGQVQPNFESQPPVSSFIGLQPEGSSPGAAGVHKDVLSGDWGPPYMQKSHGNRMIRKLSPSSDSSGIQSVTHDFISFDEAVTEQQGKIRRHSPSSADYSSSSQNSSVTNEFPAYMTSSTSPASEVLGTAGIFGVPGANPFAPGGPFSISPSSPPPTDTHSLDFNAFSTQASILVDENLGLGSGCSAIDRFGSLGCPLSSEHSLGRKPTSARLGVVSKSKATPAACTRLARKQRMDRNRKAALYQVNRVAFETNGFVSGKSGGTCSPGSLRNTSRSQPATDCRTIDRRDQENLQFLLMKVLRPSDVGNLGRIVLPKKDAESHLPWLGAREGIQFTCEDYDTGEIMTLRYRFWPNNKSRMYLLENTGDFVKKHHLQESDRMLIYRSQPQGTYIIRARKAHDCVDSLPNLDHREDMNEDTKETSEENSPGGPCSSGTSSLSGAESSQGAGHDGAPESCVSLSVIGTSQDDLLNFADLPDAPMGEGTENLVRFPSLESFDVELLELAPVNKEATSGVGKMKEEYEP